MQQVQEERVTPTKIMVPLDGSRLAEVALPEAFEFGRRGATLLLLRAAEAMSLPAADPTESQVAVVREAEGYLASVAARARKAGVDKVATSVWYGPPAKSIIDAARVRGIDLIVMSSHGRSGLGRLVLGSVAETVLRGTTTPILLLRNREAPVTVPTMTSATREANHV
jgi:nucleotide-binding universal stress UspA family protein